MIETAKEAAREGGKIVLKHYDQDSCYVKDDGSIVCSADKKAEARIQEIIHGRYPEHRVVGEENGCNGKHEYCWYIDPLDGTTNFRNNLKDCAVSVGLAHKGRFILGAICNPFTDELFWAERGKGAFLNGNKIRVNNIPASEGVSVVLSSFRGRKESKLKFLDRWTDICPRIYTVGSAALQFARFAQGWYIMSFQDKLKPWDFAAGVVIAEEAGGIVIDEHGEEPNPGSKNIISANSKELSEKAVEIIKGIYQ
ncbi:MAG: inositol monophosphatase [Nanoarchaeota archaeon]|nr:inositol monophosphatase [Nanoarchaeota archaeon]